MNKGERLSILVMKLSLFATGNQDVKWKVQNMVIVLVRLSWVEQQISMTESICNSRSVWQYFSIFILPTNQSNFLASKLCKTQNLIGVAQYMYFQRCICQYIWVHVYL